MNIIFDLLILIVLLGLAAFTSASEISIIAVSRLRLRKLSSEGSKTAKIIMKILETPERFFGTILVANDTIGALIAVIVTAISIRMVGEGRWGLVVATIVSSLLIIFSEVMAKTISARYPEKISAMLARPVRSMIIVFFPIVRGLEVVIERCIALLGAKKSGKSALVTEDEIRALIKIGAEEGVLQKEKHRLLSRVFDFSDTVVRTVMTPRDGIVSISIDAKIDDIIEEAMESGYSRLPVYKDSPDTIVGVVNMKDLLNLSINRGLLLLQDVIYPPFFVPGTKKITELLSEFQKGHTHIAMVTDERGKLAGIVTLEDLIEEIVGEIEDEYDLRAK